MLHGWYTALESALERCIRLLDGEVPVGEAWHRELVIQSTIEIPGVRPAVLPAELVADLMSLLSFRHFFRHAYAVELDPRRLTDHLEHLERIAPVVDAAIETLDRFLSATADAIEHE